MRHVAITNGDDMDNRMSGAANENPTTDASRTSSGEAGGVFCGAVEAVMRRKIALVPNLLKTEGRRVAPSRYTGWAGSFRDHD